MADVQKNVLFVVFDDLNAWAGLKSSYPGVVHTPNLDALMARGVTFSAAYCNAPLCTPSRASALTGQLPPETGLFFNNVDTFDVVDPSTTIPAIFKQSDHYVAMGGKVFHELAYGRLAEFGDEELPSDGGTTNLVDAPFGIGPYEGQLADTTLAESVEEFLASYDGAQPFFLGAGIHRPHADWAVPQEFFDLYPLDTIVLPEVLPGDELDIPQYMRDAYPPMHGKVLELAYWQKLVQAYLASISYADHILGRMIEALDASGHAEDTSIVLWSDHGLNLGEKAFWNKLAFWEETTRVPLVIVDPDHGTPGSVVDRVVSLVDLFPTLTDLAGIATPDGLAGSSLVPLLDDPDAAWTDEALTFLYGSVALRTATHRYIRYQDGSEELYDIALDPRQYDNLVDNPEAAADLTAVRARFAAIAAERGYVFGSIADDDLVGDDRDNMLVGGGGTDRLEGGAGDDIYVDETSSVRDMTVVELADGGSDTIYADGADFTLPEHVEHFIQNRRSMGAHGRGNELDNTMIGGASDDWFSGGRGDDTLEGDLGRDELLGAEGNDRLYGENGDDWLDGGAGDDLLDGNGGFDTVSYASATGGVVVSLAILVAQDTVSAGRDTLAYIDELVGSAFDDRLSGDRLDNWLAGGAGDDRLDGGGGHDVASYRDATAAVQVSLALAGFQATGGAGSDLLERIEGIAGSAYSDTLAGNGQGNSLLGGSGDDELRGGAGDDLLIGGDGDDLLDGGADRDAAGYGEAAAAVAVDLLRTGAQNTGGGGLDRLVGIEDLLGSQFADRLSGDGAANYLLGAGGNDELAGRTGDDLLEGEAGNDRLMGAGGADMLLGGDGNDLLTAGAGIDKLEGDGGDDRLDGGPGDDILEGGDGIDAAVYASATAGVTVALALGAAQATGGGGRDRLSGIEDLEGSAFADALSGDAQANHLAGAAGDDVLGGGDGDDVLEGGSGDDVLDGGLGLDLASWALAAAAVDVSLARVGAQATGDGLDTLAGIEGLVGSAFADRLVGDAADNVLEGGAGDDELRGGAGFDLASYAGAAAAVTVDLARGSAPQASGVAGADSLAAIEGLLGTAFADTLSGNARGNVLRGGDGNDRLFGREGDDILTGGWDDDRLDGGAGTDIASYLDALAGVYVSLLLAGTRQETVGAGQDTLVAIESLEGSAFADRLVGDAGANRLAGMGGLDRLIGEAGNDLLQGGAGDDELAGGAGGDRLWGGTGADVFAFAPGGGSDRIMDFEDGVDRLRIEGFGADYDTAAEVLAAAATVAGHARITLAGPGGRVVIDLMGVSLDRLDEGDLLMLG